MAKKKILIKAKKGRNTWQYKFDYMNHYLATPIDNDGTKKSYKEAFNWATNLLNEKNNIKPILFKDFTENFYDPNKSEWLQDKIADGKNITPAVLRDRTYQLKQYIMPYFKNYLLQQITVAIIKSFKVHLKNTISKKYKRYLSTQYIIHVLHNVSTILDWAVVKELIQFNPVKLAGRPSLIHKRRGILTQEELSIIFPNSIDDLKKIWKNIDYAIIAFLLADTGARRSEILALQWKHINFEHGYIIIEQAIKGDLQTIGTTKSGKSRASIIRKRSQNLLKYWKNITPYPTKKDDFIFRSKNISRQTIYPNTITNIVQRVFKEYIPNSKERNLCTHSFRHTAVSYRRREEDPNILKFQIGHTTDKMQDDYDEFTPKQIIESYINQGKIKKED